MRRQQVLLAAEPGSQNRPAAEEETRWLRGGAASFAAGCTDGIHQSKLIFNHLIFKPWDLIFTEPPRPSSTEGAALIDWGTGGAGARFFLL